jgi:hypothetical protein
VFRIFVQQEEKVEGMSNFGIESNIVKLAEDNYKICIYL